MSAPQRIETLAQELKDFNTALTSAPESLSFSIAKVGAWLKENRHALAAERDLQETLRALGRNVEKWPGVCPERGKIVAQVQLVLQRGAQEQLSEREQILNEVEAQILPDNGPAFIREEGRIVHPDGQFLQFCQNNFIMLNDLTEMTPEEKVKSLASKAAWWADQALLRMLGKLELARKIPNQDLGHWCLRNENQALAAAKRIELANSPPPAIDTLCIDDDWSEIPPELARLNVRSIHICRKPFRLPVSLGLMTGLKELTVSPLQSHFPKDIVHLPLLEKLILLQGNIPEVPQEIGKLHTLVKLSLSESKINSLPDTIGQLTCLKTLWLSRNKLTELPETISRLTALEELEAGTNQLTSVPSGISLLTRLTTVNLEDNRLEEFPPFNSAMLGILALSSNQILDIPSSIGRLGGLKTLTVSGNPIVDIAAEMASCPKLQTIWCDLSVFNYLPEALLQKENVGTIVRWNNNFHQTFEDSRAQARLLELSKRDRLN